MTFVFIPKGTAYPDPYDLGSKPEGLTKVRFYLALPLVDERLKFGRLFLGRLSEEDRDGLRLLSFHLGVPIEAAFVPGPAERVRIATLSALPTYEPWEPIS